MRNFLFCCAAVFLVLPCLAQDGSSGAIRGIVLEPVSRRMAGPTIVLVNNATNFRYQHASDSEGRFTFQLLPPQEYSARVTSDGMSPQVNDGLTVEIGAPHRSSSD